MTGRLMTPYCFAADAVAALLADSAFALRAIRAFALPAPGQRPLIPLEAIGGLVVTHGDSPLEMDVESWNPPEA